MRSLLAGDKEFWPCRVARRVYEAGRGAAPEAGGCGVALAQAAYTGRDRLKAEGQGTRGAHPKYVAHVRDLGRVEAQRLVERLRGLPSRKEGMRCGARCRLGERVLGGGGAQAACTGRARLVLKAGG